MTDSLLLKKADVCELLGGITATTLDNWRKKDPTFPAPLARVCMWRRADIEAWVAAQPVDDQQFKKLGAAVTSVRRRQWKQDD